MNIHHIDICIYDIYINSLWPSDAMVSITWVNSGLGNGLSPVHPNPLPKPAMQNKC